MLYSYSTNLNVASGNEIAFNTNIVQTGCTATHLSGATTISLNRPGFYKVELVGSVTASTAAGDIEITMRENGVDSTSAFTIVSPSATTDNVSFVIDAIVQVRPNCAAVPVNVPKTISFISDTTDALYNVVSVIVTKLA